MHRVIIIEFAYRNWSNLINVSERIRYWNPRDVHRKRNKQNQCWICINYLFEEKFNNHSKKTSIRNNARIWSFFSSQKRVLSFEMLVFSFLSSFHSHKTLGFGFFFNKFFTVGAKSLFSLNSLIKKIKCSSWFKIL